MAARRIYLASSWRNPYYFDVLAALRLEFGRLLNGRALADVFSESLREKS